MADFSFSPQLAERVETNGTTTPAGGKSTGRGLRLPLTVSPESGGAVGSEAIGVSKMQSEGNISLEVQGADLIDGTPILDIKPYIAYGDSIPTASSGFAQEAPGTALEVTFSDQAWQQLNNYRSESPELETMLTETLALDPRPAYRQNKSDDQEYGVLFDRYNVHWKVAGEELIILNIEYNSADGKG